MTEKRFSQKNEDDWEILDRTHHFAYAHSGYQASKIIDELNELVDTNRELYRENEQLKFQLKECREHKLFSRRELEKENKQLKKQKARYKLLSEIRNEEINNRILTIKEFIDNCSNEKVKKALKDLFYSEVNEYDLSKKYRKLHEENEVLKLENKLLKTTIGKNEAYIDRLTHKSDWSNNAKTSLRPKPVKNRRDMK